MGTLLSRESTEKINYKVLSKLIKMAQGVTGEMAGEPHLCVSWKRKLPKRKNFTAQKIRILGEREKKSLVYHGSKRQSVKESIHKTY